MVSSSNDPSLLLKANTPIAVHDSDINYHVLEEIELQGKYTAAILHFEVSYSNEAPKGRWLVSLV